VEGDSCPPTNLTVLGGIGGKGKTVKLLIMPQSRRAGKDP